MTHALLIIDMQQGCLAPRRRGTIRRDWSGG